MIRRSRCVTIVALLVVLQLVALSLLNYTPHGQRLLQAAEFKLKLSELPLLFKKPETLYSFDKWADSVFELLIDKQDDDPAIQMLTYLLRQEQDSRRFELPMPEFLREGKLPHLLPFDPKFALGVLLNDLQAKIEADEPLAVETFHWGDYSDLSALEPYYFESADQLCLLLELDPAKKRLSKLQDIRNPPSFCVNDADIPNLLQSNLDPHFHEQLLEIHSSPVRTGFHVFEYPGRTTLQLQVIESELYLSDFMPAPPQIVLMFPHKSGQLVLVPVPVKTAPGYRRRLVDSAMAQKAAEKGTLDLRQQLDFFISHYGSQEVAEPAAEHELTHEMFVDDLEVRMNKLLLQETMLPLERNYFKSLYLLLNQEVPSKYFDEARLLRSTKNWAWGAHYDWRFFKGLVNLLDMQTPLLYGLTLAWLRFAASNGIKTWIAHGLLLSWYWNGLAFPWDTDVDVQMPIAELHELARKFNQSVIVDFGGLRGDVRMGRYFVDCGTWISHRTRNNGLNNIDARFIDMDLGLYIDITALSLSSTMAPLRYNQILGGKLHRPPVLIRKKGKVVDARQPDELEMERNAALQAYNCRNNHFSTLQELSPLRLTRVEGVPAYIPNRFEEMLKEEYGELSTTLQHFQQYAFLPRLRLWCHAITVQKFMRENDGRVLIDLGDAAEEARRTTDDLLFFRLSDVDYLELMKAEPLILSEYIITREATALHAEEMAALVRGRLSSRFVHSTSNQFPTLRLDATVFKAFAEHWDYEKRVKALTDKIAETWGKEREGEPEVAAQTEEAAQDETRTRPDQT